MARSYDEALERAGETQKLQQASSATLQETVAAEAIPVNNKHKDAFFKKVYESEKRQKNLAAYLLGVSAETIRLGNIRPIILGEKENDLALLCDNIIYIMIECQSTLTPNMTYRLLEYIVAGLRELKDISKVLYSSTRILFPIPKLYTLQVGLVHKEEDLSKGVVYDMRLSDSYEKLNAAYEGRGITADLELVVHVYDFRMTLEEMYCYIQDGFIPERFTDYDKDMCNYALTANGITYMQRVKRARDTKDSKRCKEYKMPNNISNIVEYLKLLVEREIFVDLLLKEEVCNMAIAQFSRDEMLQAAGRAEGRAEGRQEGREEGREEGKAEVAITMLKDGMEIDKVAKYVKLSLERVLELQVNLLNS